MLFEKLYKITGLAVDKTCIKKNTFQKIHFNFFFFLKKVAPLKNTFQKTELSSSKFGKVVIFQE